MREFAAISKHPPLSVKTFIKSYGYNIHIGATVYARLIDLKNGNQSVYKQRSIGGRKVLIIVSYVKDTCFSLWLSTLLQDPK